MTKAQRVALALIIAVLPGAAGAVEPLRVTGSVVFRPDGGSTVRVVARSADHPVTYLHVGPLTAIPGSALREITLTVATARATFTVQWFCVEVAPVRWRCAPDLP